MTLLYKSIYAEIFIVFKVVHCTTLHRGVTGEDHEVLQEEKPVCTVLQAHFQARPMLKHAARLRMLQARH